MAVAWVRWRLHAATHIRLQASSPGPVTVTMPLKEIHSRYPGSFPFVLLVFLAQAQAAPVNDVLVARMLAAAGDTVEHNLGGHRPAADASSSRSLHRPQSPGFRLPSARPTPLSRARIAQSRYRSG